MQLEPSTKIETVKGVELRGNELEQVFATLKFNKKKPTYNYLSGMCAGILTCKVAMFKGQIEGDPDFVKGKTYPELLSGIIDLARYMVKRYNWKMGDLNNLAEEFFGDDNE